MEDDALQYLWTLHKVSKALIDGLKSNVYLMEKWEEIPEDKRQTMIEQVNGLIEYGEKAIENVQL